MEKNNDINKSSFWEDRYEKGEIGWDLGSETPVFSAISETLKPGSVCILGCGNGYDAISFSKRGFHVTAVDFAETPIKNINNIANNLSLTINTIQKDIFDLAIIDENLQDTTALEILEQVGGHLGLSVKYMVMSSKSSADVIRGYIESGATDFVLKPFSLPKVVTRIESILNSKPPPKVMRAEEHKAS